MSICRDDNWIQAQWTSAKNIYDGRVNTRNVGSESELE